MKLVSGLELGVGVGVRLDRQERLVVVLIVPRPPRIHVPGALFHVIARGNGGQKTFLDDRDFQMFIEALSALKKKTPFLIYAYCLMPNHFHLLIETEQLHLSVIMQRLLTRYVRSFNFRHRRIGHLFQGRFKAILCQRDAYLQELLRYIHLNPVRAKLTKDVTAWRWSSHGEYMGRVKSDLVDSEFPLSLFHKQRATSRMLYARFVIDGVEMSHNPQFYPSQSTPCLGEESFVEDYRERVNKERRIEGRGIELISLERLAALLKAKIPLEMLRSPTQARKVTAARRHFVLGAVKMGHRPSLIAAFLRCSPSAISKIIVRNL